VSWFDAFGLTPVKRVVSLGVCVTCTLVWGELSQCERDLQVRRDLHVVHAFVRFVSHIDY
jgi:hypothetical protein